MSKFEESNFYKALQDFFINADKKTFLQFLAEFYNRTEGSIDKDNIQDELIKELRELYLEFNEKGIDENIVRKKVNYFLENSLEIKNINSQLNNKANLNSVFSMANMGQDVKEAMTGGSVAVVGENTILDVNIVDEQVTPSKIKYKGLYINKDIEYPLQDLDGWTDEEGYLKVKKSILDINVYNAKQGCKYKLNYIANNTNKYGYLILVSRVEADGTEVALIKTEKITDNNIISNSVNKVIRYSNLPGSDGEWFEFIIDYSEIPLQTSLDLTYLKMGNNRITCDKYKYKEKQIFKNCFTFYKSTDEIRIASKYSNNYDLTILFNKFGVNKLMAINGVYKKANKNINPSVIYSSSDVLYQENTDWLSPYQLKAIANWDTTQSGDAWTGGSHAYNGVTGEPTAQTKLYRIIVDGKEITETISDLLCNEVIIEVVNEVEARNTHNENKRYVMEEKIRYRVVENKVEVEGKHHLKEDLEWSLYYSLETPSNFYNEIKYYDGEFANDFISYNNSVTILSGNKIDYPFVDTRILRKNNDYLKVFVDTNFGIGDRSLLADSSSNMITGTYQKTYSPLIMGKTQLVKANTNIFWRGYYEFWCLD